MAPIWVGGHGDPPRTRWRDYHKVLLQLLWRMRLDLIVWILVVVVVLGGSVASRWPLPPTAISVIGIAVSIFIAFRNTQAISRWWEARALWGMIMNGSRIWRDLLLGLLPSEQLATERGRQLLDYQVAKVWLLNFELRNFWRADVREAVTALLADLNLPADTSLQALCRQQARAIQRLHSDGWVDGFGRMQLLDGTKFDHNAIGALERIRNTPIPPSYDIFVRMITWLYGLALLMNFHHAHQVWVGIVLFLGFLIAERIGSYVEGPFDRDGNSFSLPLNSICCVITQDLLQRSLEFSSFRPSRDPTSWE
ncbi:MAG: bestrophin family ion channel [Cyanobacteria bacterium]|nr:bestrophin family ion channel [Cyanobacteriota bacterium]